MSDLSNRITECPNCGCRELGKGKQDGYATMYNANKVFSMGSKIFHSICTRCGLIVQSYVEKPERFKEE